MTSTRQASAPTLAFAALIFGLAACAPAKPAAAQNAAVGEAPRPAWDEALATRLRGALVIVGITYTRPSGNEQVQFYGVVERADPIEGIRLRLKGRRDGEVYDLPPDLWPFEAAAPGSYRLRSTGEVVEDPDFTSAWVIEPPAT